MTNPIAGYVNGTHDYNMSFFNYDMRFLNPFRITNKVSGSNKIFGERYGYIQFIYIACILISLIFVFIHSSDTSKLPLKLLFLIISYFILYYGISCLIVPNDHERCYILAWLFLIGVIISTVLTIFGESLLVNIFKFIKNLQKNPVSGGAHCYKKDEQDGGAGCHKKDEQEGGGNCNKSYEQDGGAHCYKKDEQDGGAHCYKKDEQDGGGNCYKKDEQEGGFFKY